MTYRIKVLDEQNKTVAYVSFIDNLTIVGEAPYVNCNGRMGIRRIPEGRFEGELVIMYFYPQKQGDSYAEFISEDDAYNLCAHRNLLNVADDLQLQADNEVEVL